MHADRMSRRYKTQNLFLSARLDGITDAGKLLLDDLNEPDDDIYCIGAGPATGKRWPNHRMTELDMRATRKRERTFCFVQDAEESHDNIHSDKTELRGVSRSFSTKSSQKNHSPGNAAMQFGMCDKAAQPT